MNQHPKTIKIVADTEGGHVIINESDFDKSIHEVFEGEGVTKKAPPLNVEQLKAALADKNITIPEGVTKKADLQALLDNAPKA